MVNINMSILSNVNIFPNVYTGENDYQIGFYIDRKIYRKRIMFDNFASQYDLGILNSDIVKINAFVCRKDLDIRQTIPSRTINNNGEMLIDFQNIIGSIVQIHWGDYWTKNYESMFQYIVFIIEYIKK